MAVSYTVSRDGGAAAASCTNISTTSCTDTFASSTTARTFTYAVTAKVGTNWTATSATFQGSPTTATPPPTSSVVGITWVDVTVNGTAVTPTCSGTVGSTYSCTVTGANNAIVLATARFVDSNGAAAVHSTTTASVINMAYTGKTVTDRSTTLTVDAGASSSSAQGRADKNGSNPGSMTATFNGWTAVLTIS